jgi:hypothetical protein
MSYSDRLKDINDNESSVIDDNRYIERNCSQCNICMKVSIKHLPKKDYCKECKNNLSCLIDAVK